MLHVHTNGRLEIGRVGRITNSQPSSELHVYFLKSGAVPLTGLEPAILFILTTAMIGQLGSVYVNMCCYWSAQIKCRPT